ncbi:ABC transporter permease [Kordiimonas marina]|uniref:ABC transporter permease n=1 Tax=Kordiimonas marina TaxID=2872312 RepID=UPI001FF59DA9|nr:ABC transporter permease [Kordiimonas marina]MCJ9427740.1 ABC transporter permease [Kordiimonas marina]
MTVLETMKIALEALKLNALRTALAMLGIVIGVASVIAMASISAGASKQIEDHITNLGSNLLFARPGSTMIGGRQGGSGSSLPFRESDVAAIRQSIPEVAAITGNNRTGAAVIYGNKNWQTSIQGVDAAFHEVRNWHVSEGRGLADEDVRRKAKVAVIGQTVARELFGETPPIGQRIRIKAVPFTVIGILEKKGQSGMGNDQDDTILVPISTARARLARGSSPVPDPVDFMMISVADGADMGAVQSEIEDLLMKRRHIRPGEQADFDVRNMAEFIATRTATQATLGLLLAAAAAISLIVGGIGIMNIMLVSVTERTREIGLRMAVGARERDILIQFLVEAMTLCLIGGIIGLTIGGIGAAMFARLGHWPVLLDPVFVAVGLVGSGAVGLFFGYYPARRASRLNPIEALRYE